MAAPDRKRDNPGARAEASRVGTMVLAVIGVSGDDELLASDPQRMGLLDTYLQLIYELEVSIASAGGKRKRAKWMTRVFAATTALAAATGGAGIAAQLTTARSRAVVIVIGSLLGAASAFGVALNPEADYERNRGKSRTYEGLERLLAAYLQTRFPTDDLDTAFAMFQRFSAAYDGSSPLTLTPPAPGDAGAAVPGPTPDAPPPVRPTRRPRSRGTSPS